MRLTNVVTPPASNATSIPQRPSATNSPNTSSSNSEIPADIAEIRKANMNSDIIDAFKSTCPPGVKPYITGIGLYTHVDGSKNVSTSSHGENTPPQPIFLPIPQPLGSVNSGSKLPEEVRKLWVDLRGVIQDEERLIGKRKLELEELSKRYEALPAPEKSTTPVQHEKVDVVMQDGEGSEDGEIEDTIAVPVRNSRSQSGHIPLDRRVATASDSNEKDAMQGMEGERGTKLPPSTQIYGPDPRKQRRQVSRE
ncbi:uncharacterized protein SETTUDRAFT_39794 [Exserohilum turcica Et28A]|uniref:Uncharacterized protein n=1 Tax=Exserohilum turcicum (strain 28A) TaxID=671987 RepID=R0ILV5_EXST2|nr:uncharacterized protein SETTUDRAFT_39794 [Exserohilum turcica Et28A]EOA86030.1 hypothetical protein SETTUDRAFT_39794 [Exserohilum turcica Et28A]